MTEANVGNAAPSSASRLKDKGKARETQSTLDPISSHHTRVVLDTIGVTVAEFRDLRVALSCLADAVQAQGAMHNAGILHGDVTPGNILIVNGKGALRDWDLSSWIPVTKPK